MNFSCLACIRHCLTIYILNQKESLHFYDNNTQLNTAAFIKKVFTYEGHPSYTTTTPQCFEIGHA